MHTGSGEDRGVPAVRERRAYPMVVGDWLRSIVYVISWTTWRNDIRPIGMFVATKPSNDPNHFRVS